MPYDSEYIPYPSKVSFFHHHPTKTINFISTRRDPSRINVFTLTYVILHLFKNYNSYKYHG